LRSALCPGEVGLSKSYGGHRAADEKPKRLERGRYKALEPPPQTWADLWALCRREHGLTWDEFLNLTLAELEALEDRRATEIRHARFNAALITSAIYNSNRSADSPAMSPFDLIPGFEPDPAEQEREERRRSIKKAIAVAMTRLPDNTPPEVMREMKDKMLARAKASGVEDAEELYREVFPND
jgi:hypothetical protein